MSAANIIIGLLVLGWIVTKQVTRQPLTTKTRLSLILGLIGLAETWSFAQHTHLTGHDVALTALSMAVGVGLALVRARTVRVWADDASVWQQGTWVTAALWVAGIAQHLLIDSQVARGLGTASLLLYFGIVIFAQRVVIVARARTRGLVPQATAGSRH